MLTVWLILVITRVIILTYSESQIVPDVIDYQYFPLPNGLDRTNKIGELKTRQSTINFLSCRIVQNQVCPNPDINFYLYTKTHPETPEFVRISADPLVSNLNETAYNSSNPSKIIIHGYNSDMNIAVLQEVRRVWWSHNIYKDHMYNLCWDQHHKREEVMVTLPEDAPRRRNEEYLKTRDYNVFAVDWSPLNQAPCYLGALVNIRLVGTCCAQLVQRLREIGAEDIHVIGFSLGAHVTNFMAVALRPYKLPRITGLDPALPGFVTPFVDDKLDKSDANFVDVYHTNAFVQGVVERSGHVDFYMNGGVLQPGCWAENRFFACNHHRAPLYFAESINTAKGFWGWPCDSFWQFVVGGCPPHDPQVLGGDRVDATASGMYLVITESVSPYAIGRYEGPSVEIYFKSNQDRLAILRDYKQELAKFVDMDELMNNMYGNDTVQDQLDEKLAEDTFQLSDQNANVEDFL